MACEIRDASPSTQWPPALFRIWAISGCAIGSITGPPRAGPAHVMALSSPISRILPARRETGGNRRTPLPTPFSRNDS